MAGFGLNLKLVLYLQSQSLTKSLGFLNPPLLQAAERQAVRKPFFLLKFSHFPITTTQITPFKKFAFLGCKFNWVENKV